MNTITEELSNLISSLSEGNFNILIKNYCKEYYEAKDVRIVNGPYDGGIDLEIYRDEKPIKKSIQITVQKTNLKDKITRDLKSAKENVERFAYLSKLDFFINKNLSGDFKRELRRTAEVDYNINLNFFDSNDLAELSETYNSIKESVFEIFDSFKSDSDFIKIDKQTKILYDVLSLGKDTGEIKKQFIHSFIYTFIYDNPDTTYEKIIDFITEKLNIDDKRFYRNQIDILKSKGILLSEKGGEKINLSVEKAKQIEDLIKANKANESLLKTEIETLLKEYDLHDKADEIVEFLQKTYQENYRIDLDELKQNTNNFALSIKRVFNDFNRYLSKLNIDERKAKVISNKLLQLCERNEFLNKIAASLLFTSLYQSNKLEKYLNHRIQNVLIDTQILLRLICVQYSPIETIDQPFQSVKHFYETCKNFKQRVQLSTTLDYIEEVAGHIQEAMRLERFYVLPIFAKLEHSKNVFFNFYKSLKEQDILDEEDSISDFIRDLLNINLPSYNDESFISIIVQTINNIYELAGISVIKHPYYENYFDVKREYETSLAFTDKTRTYIAREHDLRTIIYLSSPEFHIDEEIGGINEPFLITWDSAFYDARRRITNTFKNSSYWYIYSPSKFADRLSLMNFRINTKALNYNVIALTESNFNYTTRSNSFIDVLSTFFNKEDLGDIKLVHKLAELEKSTKGIDEKPDIEEVKEEVSPMVDILTEIRNYYQKPDSKFKIDDLIMVFEDNSFENTIFEIFKRTLDKYLSTSRLDDSLFDNFNGLIIKNKEAK